ncbi:hypothetical protein NFI96_017071 [Prochilodus magdalenae]|nr:hypothetical protein NFI96_017071 [Prochilodus magdalenae]
MSEGRAPSGTGLNAVELKDQQAVPTGRALSRTYLLSSSLPPLPRASGSTFGESLKLPSLARTAHRRTSMVPLSISEPSLFTPVQRVVYDGFPRNYRPSPRKHAPSLSFCKLCDKTNGPPQIYQPAYAHFSHPIRPVSKPDQPITRARRLTAGHCGLRPLVKQCRQTPNNETLSIRGTPCLPSRPSAAAAATTSRTQLHVFLPVEGAGEEEDKDSESIDEGFMDEVENKVSILKHPRGDSKTPGQRNTAASLKANLVHIGT